MPHRENTIIRFTDCLPENLPAGSAPLGPLPYQDEIRIKADALLSFWKRNRLPSPVPTLLSNPRPREYRTTSKRRVVQSGKTWHLSIEGEAAELLEPESDRTCFSAIDSMLRLPAYSHLARALNWVILRSNGHRETVLVLNATRGNASLSRLALKLKDALTGSGCSLQGLILFSDPANSDFYLDSAGTARTLWGRDSMLMQIAGKRLFSPVLAFTQVSLEGAGLLVETALEFATKADCRISGLLDVYCGYGLFSVFLGNNLSPHTLGIDISERAILAARRNNPRGTYRAASITPSSISRLAEGRDELIVVDPPRSGLDPAVLQALAARQPAAVITFHCDIDTAPDAILRWDDAGYGLAGTRAIDMFPGCSALELASLFLPR